MTSARVLRCAGRAGMLLAFALAAPAARANTELDRKYALETIGTLRSWDNVDNLFADYVAAAYKDYFAGQTRFRLQDLSKADPFFNKSKLPYPKIIEDTAILAQLARVTRSDSVLRTRIVKEGPQYQATVDWLHAPAMDLIATQSFALGDLSTGGGKGPGLGDIKSALQKGLDELFAKVPFVAHVTGRDNNTVTVNMGAGMDLKKGDALVVGTLDEVKKHPLLHTIVEWRLSPTGKLEVDQVEDAIAFCHVVQEEEGRKVSRYQKITQILPRPIAPQPLVVRESDEVAAKLEEPPHLGWASGSLWAGSFSRQFGSQTGTTGVTGGGLLLGGRADGELWFTREFFADLGVAYGTFGHGQTDIATGLDTGANSGGTLFSLKAAVGYSYTITPDFFGPKGWVKLGYHSTSYSLPVVATALPTPFTFTAPFGTKALFVGLGGDLPIRAGFGAKLDLEYALYTSGSETGSTAGDIGSTHNASVFIGGYYRYRPRITFMAGFYIEGASADYPTGNSLSYKLFTFVPSVLYYF